MDQVPGQLCPRPPHKEQAFQTHSYSNTSKGMEVHTQGLTLPSNSCWLLGLMSKQLYTFSKHEAQNQSWAQSLNSPLTV